MRRPVPLVAALALLLVAGAWWLRRDTDARRIERRLQRLLELAEKAPGETSLAGVERARAITALFARRFEFRARPFGFHTTDARELARAIHAYRSSSERIWARAYERELTVDGAARRAALRLTAEFGGGARPGREREAYRFLITWVEEDGEWRIDSADLLEIVAARL